MIQDNFLKIKTHCVPRKTDTELATPTHTLEKLPDFKD